MWVFDGDHDLINLKTARQIFVQERRIKVDNTALTRWCVVASFVDDAVVVRHFQNDEAGRDAAQQYVERLGADLGVME